MPSLRTTLVVRLSQKKPRMLSPRRTSQSQERERPRPPRMACMAFQSMQPRRWRRTVALGQSSVCRCLLLTSHFFSPLPNRSHVSSSVQQGKTIWYQHPPGTSSQPNTTAKVPIISILRNATFQLLHHTCKFAVYSNMNELQAVKQKMGVKKKKTTQVGTGRKEGLCMCSVQKHVCRRRNTKG